MSTAPSGAVPRPLLLQFRLATALVTMFAVALACAGLARPTPFWAGTLLFLALLSLLACILTAIYRSGSARAFAVGFLVFGGGYLVAACLLDRSLHTSDNEAGMPTSRAALWVYWQTHAQNRRAVTVTPGSFGGNFGGGMGGTGPPPAPVAPRVVQVSVFNPQNFVEVVHSVLIVLLGILGGLFGRFLYLTPRQRASDEDRPEVKR